MEQGSLGSQPRPPRSPGAEFAFPLALVLAAKGIWGLSKEMGTFSLSASLTQKNKNKQQTKNTPSEKRKIKVKALKKKKVVVPEDC